MRLGPHLSRLAPRVGLSLWVVAVLIVGAYLLGGHLLTLPKPATDDRRLSMVIESTRSPESRGHWFAVHVLYEGCGCSARVLSHLLERHAGPRFVERILLVGGQPDEAAKITAAGFEYQSIDSEQLDRIYGIKAAPLLIVADASGTIRYVGGYGDRKQSELVRDEEIFTSLDRGMGVNAYPVFGCAVSAELQQDTDPLGLRRR